MTCCVNIFCSTMALCLLTLSALPSVRASSGMAPSGICDVFKGMVPDATLKWKIYWKMHETHQIYLIFEIFEKKF